MSQPETEPGQGTVPVTNIAEKSASADHLPNKTHVQDEISWGLAYRTRRYGETKRAIPPKRSPIDIPFRVCRESQRLAESHSKSFPRWDSLLTSISGSGDKSKSKTKSRRESSKKSAKSEQVSLLDRSTLSQKEYMELLSKPNPSFFVNPCRKKKKKKKQICCKCELEPCPPRIVELSIPLKRLVIDNWKMYEHTLSTERILHLNELLHTNKNLEPKDARYYFKQLDKMKHKEKRKRLRAKRKKKLKKLRGDRAWLKKEVSETARVIVEYIRNEPLLALNYKQMMISECLLDSLESNKVLKKPKRTTHCPYKQTVVDISDKTSVWIDSLVKFVDMFAVQAEERVTVPSLIDMLGEEEEEEEEEEEGESEWETSEFSEGDEGLQGIELEGEEEAGMELDILDMFGGEYGEGEDLDYLNELTEDQLARLIRILSNCSEEYLAGEVDPERMPGVTYADVLERLRQLHDGMRYDASDKPFLEQLMIDWARRNEPDQVDQKLLDKIEETAALLQRWLLAQAAADVAGAGGLGGVDGEGIGAFGGLEPLIEEEPTTSEGSEYDETRKKLEDEFNKFGVGDGEDGPEITQEFDTDYTKVMSALPDDMNELAQEGIDIGGGEGGAGATDGAGAADGAAAGGDSEERDSGEGAATGAGEGGSSGEGGATGEEGGAGAEGGAAGGAAGMGEGDEAGEGAAGGGKPETEGALIGADGVGGWRDRDIPDMIKGHKPSVVFEHSPDTVCCLSLKIWAVWLLEITHNAHQWTQWISNVIQKVREYAATIRGDVLLPSGEKKVLYKEEWRRFARETEEMSVSWRQYSKHVRDLTNKIVENFHGKRVNCCPKCLQDHLIKNVVTAHETLQALTDAMNCAGYWQRCLDEVLEQTMRLTGIDVDTTSPEAAAGMEGQGSNEEAGAASIVEIEEIYPAPRTCTPRPGVAPGAQQRRLQAPSEESVYEIEECDSAEFKRK